MNIVPLIAGFVFGILGGDILFDYWRFNQKALKTQGKILRYEEYQSKDSDNPKQTMYRPSFEFSLNGITYEVKSITSFNSKVISIGQHTDILYHKGNGFGLGILFIGLSLPAIYIGLNQ